MLAYAAVGGVYRLARSVGRPCAWTAGLADVLKRDIGRDLGLRDKAYQGPIGLLLCTGKNEAIVRYSLGGTAVPAGSKAFSHQNLAQLRTNHACLSGAQGTRTPDFDLAKVALYQLS